MAVGVGGHAVDAAHFDDLAGAANLLEEPLGAELGVGGLVVGHHIGALGRDRLIDGHDHDALGDGRFDDGVQALTVGRVEDDGIHALGDEALQVGDLLGRAAVAVDDDDLVDQSAGAWPRP